jgi:hypothetical protein
MIPHIPDISFPRFGGIRRSRDHRICPDDPPEPTSRISPRKRTAPERRRDSFRNADYFTSARLQNDGIPDFSVSCTAAADYAFAARFLRTALPASERDFPYNIISLCYMKKCKPIVAETEAARQVALPHRFFEFAPIFAFGL